MNFKQFGIMALIALVVALGVVIVTSQPSQNNVIEEAFGDATNYDQVGIGSLTYGTQVLQVAAGTSTAFWRNMSGETQFVLSRIVTSGTASTSYRHYVGTTTAPVFPTGNYTVPLYSSSITGFVVATSTTATSTSSYGPYGGLLVSDRWIPVKTGEYVGYGLFNASGVALAPLATCNGATCETSTSTNRGFNVTVILEMYATSTSPNATIE